jgi:uncharacterized protein YwqG
MKPVLIILGIVIVGVVLYLVMSRRSAPVDDSAMPKPIGQSRAEPRDVAKLVEPLSRSAILIKKTDLESTSYFGGLPPDHPGFVWPEKGGRPLGFLACIDLGKVGAALDWLPRTGLLLFFYDMKEQPWGFDPKDRGGWAVIYVQDPSIIQGDASEPDGLKADWKIRRHSVRFEMASLPPSWQENELEELSLSDEEEDALSDLRSSLYGDSPHHQIGGYPDPIQSPEMDLECQLVSHGLYCGDPSCYGDPKAEELKPGASDWRLLLQMDTDDDLKVMWGDVGMIYFWVRAQDAANGDFSDAWLILQCH